MSSQPASIFAPIPLSDRMEEPLRVVLLGKTGFGKSSLGNTLMGGDVFTVNRTANSGTSKCQAATKSNGEITVIDTPGFFDTQKDEENLKSEIIKSIVECSPGPHAFLILLKVEKYTEHEIQVITKIKQYFSEEAFKYAVLVFTHGDQLEGMSIKDFVRENEALQDLSEKCGGRCHVIDNKYWKNNPQEPYRNNQFQVRELLKTINEMVKNGGGCYTNQMLEAVERNIRQEERTAGSREEAKKNVAKTLLKKMAGFSTDVLTRALLGDLKMIALVIAGFVVAGAAGGGAGAAVACALGAAVKTGAVIGAVGGVAAAGAVGGAGYLIHRGASGPAGYEPLANANEEAEANTARTTGESSRKLMKPKNE